jgi:S-DNA-T family DNA segregation ATPase FtsK/SpoIIIE
MQLPEIKDENNTIITSNSSAGGDTGALDELFEDAANIVVMGKSGSTSAIQRKFQVGYNRAGRIMDQLEKYQIVGPYNGSKAREVLVEPIGLDQILNDLRQKGVLKNF